MSGTHIALLRRYEALVCQQLCKCVVSPYSVAPNGCRLHRDPIPAAEILEDQRRWAEITRTSLASDTPHRELLAKLERVLKPLDSKIDFSLHIGTAEQMRADLAYLRGLLGEAHAAIDEALR